MTQYEIIILLLIINLLSNLFSTRDKTENYYCCHRKPEPKKKLNSADKALLKMTGKKE